MLQTINLLFEWPSMGSDITNYVTKCGACKACKTVAPKIYGEIPMPDNTKVYPWNTTMVDMIGPWKVQFKHNKQTTTEKSSHLHVLTKGRSLLKAVPSKNKTSQHVADLFNR